MMRIISARLGWSGFSGTAVSLIRAASAVRELLTGCPTIRAAGGPDYLLSAFINGIRRLPCDLG